MAGNGEIENDREQRKRDRAERQRKEREREKESEEGMEGWRDGGRDGERERRDAKCQRQSSFIGLNILYYVADQ